MLALFLGAEKKIRFIPPLITYANPLRKIKKLSVFGNGAVAPVTYIDREVPDIYNKTNIQNLHHHYPQNSSKVERY